MTKTLVIYYSAEGHTKRVAEIIASMLNADLYEITPKEPYTREDLDWTNNDSRCSKQWGGALSQEVELVNADLPNWSDYDTVIFGYPIWWGYAAFPAASFVAGRDFKGKTIIPFCTSHTSGIGDSDLKLRHSAIYGDWREAKRFFQDAPESEITAWLASLNLV